MLSQTPSKLSIVLWTLAFVNLATSPQTTAPRSVLDYAKPLPRHITSDWSGKNSSTPQSEARDLQESQPQGMYVANPSHLWNRIYRQFYVRKAGDGHEYGDDALDPLLWPETKYLRSGPSHQQALQLLDEFLSTNGERLITDPVKRSILQHDMWAIFDWLSNTDYEQRPTDKELLRKVAEVIHRLALTPQQIQSLPDTYAAAITSGAYSAQYNPRQPEAAFLPPDLFAPDGGWVCLGTRSGPGAPVHTGFFSGRSVFLVFLRLPGGRGATLTYLKGLGEFPSRLIPSSGGYFPLLRYGPTTAGASPQHLVPNPNLPQFPTVTQVALVRRMTVINSQGELTPTNLTESVQIRVFRDIPSRGDWLSGHYDRLQDVFEFHLSGRRLFAGDSGGLGVVTRGDRQFPQFLAMPFDQLEQRPGESSEPIASSQKRILDSCEGCHGAPGIHSMLSPRTIWGGQDNSELDLLPSSPSDQATSSVAWKKQQYNWGLLRELWK